MTSVTILTPEQAAEAKTAAKAAFLSRLADAETAAWRRADDSELHARLQASLIDRARTHADRWWDDITPGSTPHADPLRFGDRIVLDDGTHAVYCGRSVREGIHEVVVRGQDGEWSTRRLSIGVDTLRAARARQGDTP